jgi:hypothetical protein
MSSHAERTKLLKAEPSLEGFIAWLETKDPNEEYDYHNSEACACGQYAASIHTEMWLFDTAEFVLWDRLNGLACSRDAQGNWTFGHTLKVAREMLKFERSFQSCAA